ncbi:MAG: hypothetical protein P1U78_12020 [Alcanivoracaceae bacterium]|nr:hypothetical protein [Alcanivoracaceae bacterium]
MTDRSIGLALFALVVIGLLSGKPEARSDMPLDNVYSPTLLQQLRTPSEEELLLEQLGHAAHLDNPEQARRGAVRSVPEQWRLSDYEVRQTVQSMSVERRSYTYTWNLPSGTPFAITAEGTFQQHHFAHGYLTDWQPFAANRSWEPWYAVAQRLSYQRDHHRYAGRLDVWQTGAESWRLGSGDCEDHALLLADWLNRQGEDARVVLGKYQGEGHAWVVIIRDQRAWLLEATRKFGRRALRQYPLASTLPDYQPAAMFNRDTLWINDGSHKTTRYDGPAWRVAAHFQP